MLAVNQLSVSQVFDAGLELIELSLPAYKAPYSAQLPSFSDFDALSATYSTATSTATISAANHQASAISPDTGLPPVNNAFDANLGFNESLSAVTANLTSVANSNGASLTNAIATSYSPTSLTNFLPEDVCSYSPVDLISNAVFIAENSLQENHQGIPVQNNYGQDGSLGSSQIGGHLMDGSLTGSSWQDGVLLSAADGAGYGSHDDVNNSILNEVFQGALNDNDAGGTYQAAPVLPNHATNQVVSQLDSKFNLDNMHPELLLQEPVLILILAVIFEMLLPIPLRFKFSGLQPIFHRLGHKVNLPHSSNSQRAFAGFFLPLLLLIFCEGVVLFLDVFTEQDSIITLLVMVYLLELRYPQETACKISSALQKGNKEEARDLLYPYVLRDVSKLSSMGIAKAACESTILRITHGWFAVMVWYFIGGIEGAVLMQCCVVMSRAFNYKLPDNYLFGRVIFMLLELMLVIPALALGVLLMFSKNPLSPWVKGMHGMQVYPAPITGFILGAVGGALDLSLSGPRYYFGRLIRLPRVGGAQDPNGAEILRVMRKIRLSGILMLLVALVISLN